MAGCIYHMSNNGIHPGKLINFDTQLGFVADVFGNTVFAFIFHHSTAGIVVPVRPQTSVKKMLIQSHIIGASFLGILGMFAWLTFGEYTQGKYVVEKPLIPEACPDTLVNCHIQ